MPASKHRHSRRFDVVHAVLLRKRQPTRPCSHFLHLAHHSLFFVLRDRSKIVWMTMSERVTKRLLHNALWGHVCNVPASRKPCKVARRKRAPQLFATDSNR